jgi:hypothetical protein
MSTDEIANAEQKRSRFMVAVMWFPIAAVALSITFTAGREYGRNEFKRQGQTATLASGKPIALSPLESQLILSLEDKNTESIHIHKMPPLIEGMPKHYEVRVVKEKTKADQAHFGEDGIVIEDQD